jgi:hypothetical protein
MAALGRCDGHHESAFTIISPLKKTGEAAQFLPMSGLLCRDPDKANSRQEDWLLFQLLARRTPYAPWHHSRPHRCKSITLSWKILTANICVALFYNAIPKARLWRSAAFREYCAQTKS